MLLINREKLNKGDIVNVNLDKLKSKKVSQPNTLVESPYAQEFTANEIKLFEIAVADCKENDIELFHQKKNKTYKFSNSELAKLLNTSSSIVSQSAERIADNIMKKYISLKSVLSDGSIEFEKISIMPYSKYKNGVFEFDINFRMIPLLININVPYTEYHLHYLLSMSSAYAIKLYKLLYQYKNIGKRRFLIDELKNQFGIINKYSQYTDFKKYIINPSIKQINERTNLKVEYSEIKFGRRIDKLEFIFEIKKVTANVLEQAMYNADLSNIINISELGGLVLSIEGSVSSVTKKIISEYYMDKGVDYVEASIVYAKKNAKTNFDKYLVDTLKKGWAEFEVRKTLTNKNLKSEKMIKKTQKSQEREQDNLNKSRIEHEWNKLLDSDKVSYANYADYILRNYSNRLSNFNTDNQSLVLCIYATTNNKSYDRVLESYIKNILNVSLNINDTILYN